MKNNPRMCWRYTRLVTVNRLMCNRWARHWPSQKHQMTRVSLTRASLIAVTLFVWFIGTMGFSLPVMAAKEAGKQAGKQADREAGKQENYPVKITKNLPYLDITLTNGKRVRLERNQDTDNMVDFDYAYTSRACPPYCIHPISLGSGVETVGELEIIEYLRRISAGDDSVLIIDTRTDNWLSKGMIPGAVLVPWSQLHYGRTSQEDIIGVLEFEFGVTQQGQLLNFEHAKTLVLYCNGSWCGQSVTSINSLRLLGYPAEKLKWYRNGIQGWVMLGLTLVTPRGDVIGASP